MNIESKDTAKELIRKYLPLSKNTDYRGVNCLSQRLSNAKQCAIEEIKGIKKALEDYADIIKVESPIYKWEQVEKEIHKI